MVVKQGDLNATSYQRIVNMRSRENVILTLEKDGNPIKDNFNMAYYSDWDVETR